MTDPGAWKMPRHDRAPTAHKNDDHRQADEEYRSGIRLTANVWKDNARDTIRQQNPPARQ